MQVLEIFLKDHIVLSSHCIEKRDFSIGGALLDVSQHRNNGCDSAAARERDNASVPPFVEIKPSVRRASR